MVLIKFHMLYRDDPTTIVNITLPPKPIDEEDLKAVDEYSIATASAIHTILIVAVVKANTKIIDNIPGDMYAKAGSVTLFFAYSKTLLDKSVKSYGFLTQHQNLISLSV